MAKNEETVSHPVRACILGNALHIEGPIIIIELQQCHELWEQFCARKWENSSWYIYI